MTTKGIDLSLDFSLKDGRSYVRTTDFLREIANRFPNTAVSVRFLRPIHARSVMSRTRPEKTTAAITLGEDRFYVGDDAGKPPPDTATSAPNPDNFNFRIGSTYFFFFRKRRSFLDNLEACFDITHPRLSQQLGVKTATCSPDIGAGCRCVWFRLRGLDGREPCQAAFYTPFRNVCKIRFFDRRRAEPR